MPKEKLDKQKNISKGKSKSRATYFDDNWFNNPDYCQWIKRGSSNTTYRCKVCKEKSSERKLGDMGVGALKKHAKQQSHQNNLKDYLSAISYYQPKESPALLTAHHAQSTKSLEGPSSSKQATETPCSSSPSLISSYMKTTTQTSSEIVYAMNCIYNGYSDNSIQNFNNVLRAMCPDSKIAKEFEMGPNKLKYVTNHGLYPYFKEELQDELTKSPYIVIMFDESLNDVLQRSEMDVHIRYWDNTMQRVKVRYWDSRFLGHTTSQDLLDALENVLIGIDVTKILQLSMDGPNTNIKLLENYKKKRETDELKELVDIGTCNLHTVHGAFETGEKASQWKTKELLKGSHRILHDTPARREDYFNLTGSKTYPLQFCSTRWVEDKPVAERLIEIWHNIVKIFDFWKGLAKSKQPKSKSYENVLGHINDILVKAKLHFFAYVAGIMKPYLTCFQGDGPMVPYINDDLMQLMKSLLQIVVKPSVLAKNNTSLKLLKLELQDDENLLPLKKIHLGFAAENEVSIHLSTKETNNESVMKLREQARNFVVGICDKLAVRNPLGYSIVRNANCFNPVVMMNSSEETLVDKMKRLTTKLVTLKIISFQIGDKALTQYREFLGNEKLQHKDQMRSFDRKSTRLDDLFFSKMKIEDCYPDFAMIMKIVFTLSHGQASVERGFNDNNVVLKVNQKEDTVVARRFIKNYLASNNLLPHTVLITSKLERYVKTSWRKYNQYLEEKKEKEAKEKESEEVKQLENELRVLDTQCDDLEDTIKSLDSQFIDFAKKAEERNQMSFLIQGNALKRKSEEKSALLSNLKRRILEVEAKKKNIKIVSC